MDLFARRAGETLSAYRQRMLIELAQMDKTNLSSAVETILRVSTEALCVSRAEFWRCTDDGEEIICEAVYVAALQDFDTNAVGERLLRIAHYDYFHELVESRSIVAPDVTMHHATRSLHEAYFRWSNVSAVIDTAIWAERSIYGVLCLEHVDPQREPREWTAEETMFASFSAAMITLAVEQSRRAQKEQQYRYLIENSTDGIYRTDLNGRFVFANNALNTILGYTVEEILNKQYYRFVHPDYRIKALRFYHQQLKERISSTYFEFPALRKDGSEAWLGQNVQLVLQGNDVVGFQAMVRNITQRKLAEAEIMKTLEKERQLGELKSRFVSMVLHELRTPLTGISLSTEILQRYADKIDEGQKRKSYRKIFENIKRIVSLMDGILLLSETEAKKLSFRPRSINIHKFADEILHEVISDEALLTKVSSSVQCCDTHINADETLLRHILGHLLINAVKYSMENVWIRFDVICEQDATLFIVEDKGIGIPADDIPFIFETFHRAKNAAELIPGTGVGLSVVKQCVSMHQGTIDVESTLGHGTRFTVRIPAQYGEAETATLYDPHPSQLGLVLS
jgi:PAS domain S-box-containing protein